MNPVRVLKNRIVLPSGKIREGAVSRVSEYLQVSYQTVLNWLDGTWKPGKATLAKMEDMLKNEVYLGPKKRGPKRGWKNNSLQLEETIGEPRSCLKQH